MISEEKNLAYFKKNAEEDYMKVPISVLRYISELEESKNAICEFEDIVKPVMKWLSENHHPHMHVVIESNTAELCEGQRVFNTNEFLID